MSLRSSLRDDLRGGGTYVPLQAGAGDAAQKNGAHASSFSIGPRSQSAG